VLAAGASTRLGTPKQLLVYQGRTLLRRATENALEAVQRSAAGDSAAAAGAAGTTRPGHCRVVVVIGSQAGRMRAELAGLDVCIVENPDWAEGLSTSLRAGLDALDSPDDGGSPVDAALFTTCDQPLVTAATLRALLAAYDATCPPVVACAYAGAVGVPALFDRALFAELRTLRGDAGAKRVIESHRADLVTAPAPEAALDVDTARDTRRLADGPPVS
jgi:molybdenum cofactor cytidylyltransferase